VHGDVGCGKTVVALVSMLIAVENGYQACPMAPTELLLNSILSIYTGWFEALGLRVVPVDFRHKRQTREDIQEEELKS